MIRIRELIFKEKLQYQVFAVFSVIVFTLACIAYFLDNLIFQQFLGGINPLAAGFLIILFAFALLSFLLSKGWFAVYKKGNRKGLLYATGLAALFGLIAILADFSLRFYPADINVLFPKSLLYYPAIGFYAETVFQVLPLTLSLIALGTVSKRIGTGRSLWIGILVASVLEPVFQVLSLTAGQTPSWFSAFEFVRIFVIIVSQLSFFKRYDFVTMYWFRIVYYMFWHIVWGYLRLILVF